MPGEHGVEQGVHAVAPFVDENVELAIFKSNAQSTHAVKPGAAPYLPGKQLTHVDAFEEPKVEE